MSPEFRNIPHSNAHHLRDNYPPTTPCKHSRAFERPFRNPIRNFLWTRPRKWIPKVAEKHKFTQQVANHGRPRRQRKGGLAAGAAHNNMVIIISIPAEVVFHLHGRVRAHEFSMSSPTVTGCALGPQKAPAGLVKWGKHYSNTSLRLAWIWDAHHYCNYCFK